MHRASSLLARAPSARRNSGLVQFSAEGLE